jgi:hypothetical protein
MYGGAKGIVMLYYAAEPAPSLADESRAGEASLAYLRRQLPPRAVTPLRADLNSDVLETAVIVCILEHI